MPTSFTTLRGSRIHLQMSSIRKWSRIIHRDLGYFLIGACLLYAVSGFVLSLRDSGVDVLNIRTPVEVALPTGLSSDSLVGMWNAMPSRLPKARSARLDGDFVRLTVPGARLSYDPQSGFVRGEQVKSREWLQFCNRIHFNRKGEWVWMGLFFSVGFFLLTLTGIVMVRGKKGFARRGVWFMLAGLAVMILLIYI